jgi:hypothetical protein
MDSVYLNMNNRHSKFPPWDEVSRHNWRIDKKRLKYQAAFVRFLQTRIADK